MQLKEEIADLTAKNAICKLKAEESKEQIEAEKEIARKIDDITPVKFTTGIGIDQSSMAALATAKTELQKFYAAFKHTESYEGNFKIFEW